VQNSTRPLSTGFCNSARGAVANPSRYVYYPEELPWAVAQYNCLALGGSLASLHSPEDQAAVLALMPRGGTCSDVGTGQYEGQHVGWTGQCTAWIGFHDRGQEGGCEGSQFFWSDGTSTDYQHWGQGEPNDWNAQEQSTCGGKPNTDFRPRKIVWARSRAVAFGPQVAPTAKTASSCSRSVRRASAPDRTAPQTRASAAFGTTRCATWHTPTCAASSSVASRVVGTCGAWANAGLLTSAAL